ncbi:bifunctional DNA primase/polymerase [Marinovum sp.]|uniref:bifunctional DNA primase/polymerase n=1 Tax=Marinovum sp. TaxID=2024839 RepID=UPI003A8F2D29
MKADNLTKSPNQDRIMRETADLREIHAALVRLRPKSKAPIEAAWTKQPALTGDAFLATWKTGENVGIRLGEPSLTPYGYLDGLDCDVRKPEAKCEAWAVLLRHCPNAMELPSVISGSGGDSRHIYFFTPQTLDSWTIAKGDGWEVAVKGTGTQLVAPGSIHDKTGKPYRWERRFDPGLWDLIGAPVVDVTLLQRPERMAPVAPAGPVPLDRLEAALRGIDPKDLHRDEWRNVGMALCYETGGSEAGFRAFDAFSQRDPERYKGERDTRSQWRSFGKGNRGERIKGATILFMERDAYARAIAASLDEEFEDLPELF